MSSEWSYKTRGDMALKAGHPVKAWVAYAEGAHEATSLTKAKVYDRLMRKAEWAIQHSERHMRSRLNLNQMRQNYG